MQFVWRRYAKSGYGPPWFSMVMAIAFAGLTVWAIVARDWLTAGIAAVMVIVAAAGVPLMRRLRARLDAAERERRTGQV
ncbi:MAG: hypothetical protein HY873_06880 [Chloroflexi bacterium]|nr:hypothetical protein [Chloroflexota bacterium]